MRMTREWLWVPLALMTATALLLLPFWLRGGSQGHDLFHHLLSGHFFAVQLWQGEIYPRWLMEMNGAFGSPAFFFYPPLPYYVSALFAGPEPLAHHAMIPLLWSNTLALGLSGLFAYLWLRPFATSGRALAASLLYMALPYHLAIDIYARFALAESWAFVWAPLALLAQDRLCRRAPFALLLLALAVALLTLSHLPSTLLILGLLTVRSLLLAWRSKITLHLWPTLLGQLWGLAMASLLLLPALLDQGGISMDQMRIGMFEFHRNFLDRLPETSSDWRFRGHLAWLTLLTLVLLLVAWAAAREPRHPELLIWGTLGTLSFLMMLPLSEPLWHLLPPLQLVQFPWRLNLLLVIATVAVVALGVPAYRPWQWLWWVVLALTLLSQAVYVHESPLTQAPQKSALDGEFDSKRSAREYRPKQVPKGMFAPTLLAWKDEFQPAVTTEQQGISWQILNWQPRQIVLTVDAPAPAKLILHQFDYPGWQAKLDDTLPLTISSTRNGLIQVWVPAGRHQVTFTLTARWPERLGYGLSLIAWLLWSLLLASQIRTLRRQRPG
ncbi:6-pyruvoyl-tetrahydropterin synthase-related protein [Aeromonas sobria]|uniref:6-pyruvoyl-tetrahydropterin synthase-related protein n=1 Tax=Aeromonas sobria TaxID=646 RepID=UPI0026F22264|nr:6-pyruvoyl-tetrahydropterin synthase-related protein [Aeromonas sobria]